MRSSGLDRALGVYSIRFRIASTFAVVLVVLGALALAAVNVTLERSLKESFVSVEAESTGVSPGGD